MKKNYIYPQIQIIPCNGMEALCSSGVISQGLENDPNNTGLNPWTGSRAPRRDAVF